MKIDFFFKNVVRIPLTKIKRNNMSLMAIKSKAIMQIQLDQNDAEKIGEDLLEYADTLCSALGMDREKVFKEMTSNDLNHLFRTFNNYFGEYIELLDTDNTIFTK
jgi:hypothetical protein